MTPFAHFSAGYLIYKFANIQNNAPNNSILLTFALLGSFFPDIDGFFKTTLNKHRYTIFHTPFLYSTILLLSFFLRNQTSYSLFPYLTIFSIAGLIHLFIDWISARTCGIMLFYPFSKKPHSLFPLKPEKGNFSTFPNKEQLKFWKYYLENRLLIITELLVIGAGVFLSFT